MEYKIVWLQLANTTYFEEIEFILLKWNQNEVNNFIDLTDKVLETLKKYPKIGIPHKNLFKLVISKQTSLFYKLNEVEKNIELIYFWNNKRDSN